MKKVIIGIMSVATIALTSCSDIGDAFSGDPKIDDSEDLKELATDIVKAFGKDKEVYRLDIETREELNSEFLYASIGYIENGEDYKRSYKTHPQDGRVLEDPNKSSVQAEVHLRSKQGKAKLSDFNFKKIIPSYSKACKMIPKEFEDFSLHSWSFRVDLENQITSKFTIHGTKVGEGSHREGNMSVTDYYEFIFELNQDGDIVVAE